MVIYFKCYTLKQMFFFRTSTCLIRIHKTLFTVREKRNPTEIRKLNSIQIWNKTLICCVSFSISLGYRQATFNKSRLYCGYLIKIGAKINKKIFHNIKDLRCSFFFLFKLFLQVSLNFCV